MWNALVSWNADLMNQESQITRIIIFSSNACKKLSGGDVKKSNFFSAAGKYFYFQTTEVSGFQKVLGHINLYF